MITYVNTVLVSNLAGANLLDKAPANPTSNVASADAGKFVIITTDPNATDIYVTAENAANYETIKIGLVTKKNSVQVAKDGTITYVPVIKWSNVIKAGEIKSFSELTYQASTEDVVTIDFSAIDASIMDVLAKGGKRVIVRLTFKDLPTRFRKWTESYEYITAAGETKTTLAKNVGAMIAKQWKRARVTVDTSTTDKIKFEAMPYDDDDSADSINWANKVRFNVNMYFTDPAADGWESTNKHFLTGVKIDKVPGKLNSGEGKLVRDRESQAMGYLGILNRGEGTWPVIKPEMEADITKKYEGCTLEFERTYRAADDIFRKTKETVEIYVPQGQATDINAVLSAFIKG